MIPLLVLIRHTKELILRGLDEELSFENILKLQKSQLEVLAIQNSKTFGDFNYTPSWDMYLALQRRNFRIV